MLKNVRLSKYVVPREYDIRLHPDLRNFTFEGIEKIKLSLEMPTRAITLHSKEIEIETAHAVVGGEKLFAEKISYNEKAETATLHFKKSLAKGRYELVLVFKGILNDKMRGFYRSKYTVGEKEYHMATTQFEATDARRAFPCFDEPAQKAVFHVSLVIPKGKTAISNTLPTAVEEHEGGYEIVRFAPTPKMSTYLLAFIVGDFEYLETKSKRGVQIRVFTTPGKKHQAKFALECAKKSLDFFEDYFAIKYPLPTLDMIAIPDFASGAMENWGAITYRESALLVDEKNSSIGNKQWVALVIAHELAHQWFGNLVTMEWWTHLWLNEGFASYIEYLAVDKIFPHWDIWTQFSTNDLGVALRLDSLYHTHPIEIPVHHPDEIGEIFDEVSYSKGASVIRMLASYIGERNFRDGLRYYLKKHSYKNTETVHLWQAFEKISKKPVRKVMAAWTIKPGYPVLEAKLKGNNLSLTQSRFFSSPLSKRKARDKNLWPIPVVLGNNSSKKNIFFSSKSTLYKFAHKWLKINYGESGFFRTAYDTELLEKLFQPVKGKMMSSRDHLGIIRDLFALAEAGIIPATDALSFLKAYQGENNYTVLVEIASGLARIEQLIYKTPAKKKFDKFVIDIFTPIHKRLGWSAKKNEVHSDTLLRSLVIHRLGKSGGAEVVKEARYLATKLIHPDIRGAVYSTVAINGTRKEFEYFIKRYKSEALHEERNRIGSALGDFPDPVLLKKACEFSISSAVRTQDTMGILQSVAMNPQGRDIWLSFVKRHWKVLVSRYGDGGHQLARLVKGIAASPEERHFKAFKQFFRTHDAPGAKRAIEQVLEKLESNIAWLKRDHKRISEFLNK